MHFTELIRIKRDGGELTDEQLRFAIESYTADSTPDYQMAALVMAIFFSGMNPRELGTWTDAMLNSGTVLDWSHLGKVCVDKHSTGGVGDKISIPLAPAVAACGVPVPMISGRGLGHTGGTLDKLEAIPGFQVRIAPEVARQAMDKIGVAMMGQTEEIAPADRRLYALRDTTATVESIPLISSSIMSKKLAEGIGGLVLDVKVGSGAFMKTAERATELAKTLVGIGQHAGCETVALLTRMDRPLGQAVGNAIEIEESIAVLRGGGPDDIRGLVEELGAEMLVLGGVAKSLEEGRSSILKVLDDGAALDVFRRMVACQGGDERVVDTPSEILPQAQKIVPVVAVEDGYIQAIDTREVGIASLLLGAGRAKKSDTIDPAVGLKMCKDVGEAISRGETVAELFVNDETNVSNATSRLQQSLVVGEAAPAPVPLFQGRVSGTTLNKGES